MAARRLLASLLLCHCELVALVAACTYFEVPDGGDDRYVVARSMEYAILPLNLTDWQLVTHPVAEKYATATSLTRSWEWWTVGIGHISVDAKTPRLLWHTPLDVALDGMNEHGLSVSANSFHSARYSNASLDDFEDSSQVLWFGDLTRWALSSFSRASEMIERLEKMTVISLGVPSSFGGVHWAVTDPSGDSFVIEYLDGSGKPSIFNNTVRVMTNDPDFRWQVLNLDNYAVLTPKEPDANSAIRVPTEFGAPYDSVPSGGVSAGANLRGLPGDTLPTSRFVRMFYLRGYAMLNAPPCGHGCTLALTQALLNEDFIPRGVESQGYLAKPFVKFPVSYTQWAFIKMPSAKTFMYRSYVNMEWKLIDLTRLKLGDSETRATRRGLEDYRLAVVDATDDFVARSDGSSAGADDELYSEAGERKPLDFYCDFNGPCGTDKGSDHARFV